MTAGKDPDEAGQNGADLGGGSETDTQLDADGLDDREAQNRVIEDLATQVDALQAELAATKDRWLRAVADLENYKKRTRREIEEAERRTVQKILPAFLPVLDNLERALDSVGPALQRGPEDAPQAAYAAERAKSVEQLVAGIRMVSTEFVSALGKNGIEAVPSVGQPFDPAVHDALQQIDSPDHAPGIVIREFEKGYRLGDRLIRPARVVVAGAGSTGTSPSAEPEAEN